jgi:phage gpG-like protein
MLSITGNTAKLGEFAKKIRDLTGPSAKRAILLNVAEEVIELVREGFDNQADPYGAGWAATQRGGRILADSGRLKSSWHRRSLTPQRVVVGSGVTYGRYHQSGTRRMPQRAMVPYRGMPAEWKARVAEVAVLAWKSSVGFR